MVRKTAEEEVYVTNMPFFKGENKGRVRKQHVQRLEEGEICIYYAPVQHETHVTNLLGDRAVKSGNTFCTKV